MQYNDCCEDYYTLCLDPGTAPITNAELEALSEQFYVLEATNPNNVAGFVTWDLQGRTTQGSTVDLAPNPLLAVHPNAYTTGTVALLVALHDNYNADVAVTETETAAETAEINAFLDAVLATPIMQQLQTFLTSKGISLTREKFHEMWFGVYSRSGSTLGSSGMEHIFLAELKNGVSGFHNWVFFAKEEEAGRMNYRGWMEFLDLGPQGAIVQHNFMWRNANKPISSMFIGTSPEFEMAVYSACWLTRPDSTTCPMSFGNRKVPVTTWTIGASKQYVASAYAM
jgi:poly(U)-specific endoribonuclease